jgi:hypothetical protein
MRAVLLALVLPAWLALAVSASADQVNHAVPPPALNTMKVARTNLETALNYEHRALIAAKDGEHERAHHDLSESRNALADARGAIGELMPPPAEAAAFDQANHRTEPWTHYDEDIVGIINIDKRAHERKGAELVAEIQKSIGEKKALLRDLTSAIHNACAELVNLQGPFKVNGVPQGTSQLTVSISCEDEIDLVDLWSAGSAWTNAQAGPDAVSTSAGGHMLQVNASGATTVTVTAEGNPEFPPMEVLWGDIVPIAGDSAPPVDEIM